MAMLEDRNPENKEAADVFEDGFTNRSLLVLNTIWFRKDWNQIMPAHLPETDPEKPGLVWEITEKAAVAGLKESAIENPNLVANQVMVTTLQKLGFSHEEQAKAMDVWSLLVLKRPGDDISETLRKIEVHRYLLGMKTFWVVCTEPLSCKRARKLNKVLEQLDRESVQ